MFRGNRRARVSTPPHPFKLTGFIESGTAYIRVYPGLIDNIVPTIGGVSLVRIPAPSVAVSGAAGVLWVKCTLDATGGITNAIIETGSALPEDDENYAHRMLGSFTSASGQFTSIWSALNTNQSHKRCGGYSTWGAA